MLDGVGAGIFDVAVVSYCAFKPRQNSVLPTDKFHYPGSAALNHQETLVDYKRGTFWQSILVWLLFFASIAALFVNSVTAFLLPGQELQIREMLRDAALKLVEAATEDESQWPDVFASLPQDLNQRLEQLTHRTLAKYPGVEGGFYINHQHDDFAGYAFPTEPVRGPGREIRREPPPREEPYIRLQAKQSSQQEEAAPLIQSRDVGPSRVVVATAPVGTARPARLVVWLMYRVTGPEQHRAQVSRYQISTLLALGGIVAALLLTLNLRRSLRQERQSHERLRDELRRSEHLASLGLLLAQVAHEIRNPLAGISSTVQLWERLPAESRTPESLQSVRAAVDRLNVLLSHLLYFSRNETTDRSSVNLNEIVKETFELIAAQAAQQNVVLDLRLDPQLPSLMGSPSALRQVVLNLATNALQAMPNSGCLTCRTRYQSLHRAVILEISDTGAGINPTVRSRLFEPFFTTRQTGTGLGLALCREIVLKHGGRIDLESVVPHGTMCRIELPTQLI